MSLHFSTAWCGPMGTWRALCPRSFRTARSRADPHRVLAILKDGSTWPQWSMPTFELERAGSLVMRRVLASTASKLAQGAEDASIVSSAEARSSPPGRTAEECMVEATAVPGPNRLNNAWLTTAQGKHIR